MRLRFPLALLATGLLSGGRVEAQGEPVSAPVPMAEGRITAEVPVGWIYHDGEAARQFFQRSVPGPQGPRIVGALAPILEPGQERPPWYAVFRFLEWGRVDDGGASRLAPNKILTRLRMQSRSMNEGRALAGYGSFRLSRWAREPRYDPEARILTSAMVFTTANRGGMLNHDVRVLLRNGVLALRTVGTPDELEAIEDWSRRLVDRLSVNEGHRHEDFDPAVDSESPVGVEDVLVAEFTGITEAEFDATPVLLGAGSVVFLALLGLATRGRGSQSKYTPTVERDPATAGPRP